MTAVTRLRWYRADTRRPDAISDDGGTACRGWIFEVKSADGLVGRGEASPLPGYCCEDDDDVVAAFEIWCASLSMAAPDSGANASASTVRWRVSPRPIALGASFLEATAPAVTIRSPAARFAVETALCDLSARSHGVSLAAFIAEGDAPASVLKTTAVCRNLSDVERAIAGGASALKLKLGGDPGAAAAFVRDTIALAPERAIRLDVNQHWDLAQFGQFAARAAAALATVEFIEEPVVPWPGASAAIAGGGVEFRVGADETLWKRAEGRDDDDLASLIGGLADEGYSVIVLKPTCVGGLRRARLLAEAAHACFLEVVVTHTFDGVIATAAAAELALALRSQYGGDTNLASGVGAHAAMGTAQFFRPAPGAYAATVGDRLGHGVIDSAAARLDLAAVNDALDTTALILCGPPSAPATTQGEYTFADLKAMLPGAPSLPARGGDDHAKAAARTAARRIADTDLPTCITIYAALGGLRPTALMHPAWTESEREVAAKLLDTAACPAHGDLVVFSSGSTGTPKGIWLNRENFAASAAASAANLGWKDDDRWFAALPLGHVGGLSVLTRCLSARRCAVLAPPTSSGHAIATYLDSYRITIASMVPTQLAHLLGECPDWRPHPRLRAVVLGGAPTPSTLLRDAAARGVRVLSSYGMTETTAQIACERPDRSAPATAEPCVRVLDGVDLDVRDGVIVVDGEMVATHSLDGPLPRTSDGYLLTRDRGCLGSSGELLIAGRIDDAFLVGGETIDPAEIEAVVYQVPGVAAACVFGVAHPTWGLTVALAIEATAEFDQQCAEETLSRQLSKAKRPRLVAVGAALPVNANGKLDRAAVQARFADRLRPI